ncbi:FAD-dependent oxidoreductase [Aliiglaciecola litoralis]|uniref:2-octaprenyl-3-methyl-6-methoxy-1,4-benzoquinol hydroxylase n=1 Tax=Aliiglaciecola litoralis TaxID=582857 RepID=A0ABP3WSR3_9ALTE
MFDVCVVGGGMIGAATAVGLAQQGRSVALLETHLPPAYSSEQPPDMRVSALNLFTQSLLQQLNAWQFIESKRLCPFKRMSVWENENAATHFSADEVNAPYLGHIVENRLVQLALLEQVALLDKVTLFEQKQVSRIDMHDSVSLTLEGGEIVQCKLLVGADGGLSRTRQQLHIGTQGWQYQQHALGINIQMQDRVQQDITWQAFRSSGPLAFLPLFDGYASLVWYDSADTISALKKLNNSKLKAAIKANFPAHLGDFDILKSVSFPLTRMHANQYVKGNAVLIGDAAHTINPLAGQGVNLGFKDVAALLDAVQSWNGEPAQLHSCLASYERKRRNQNLLMMSAMDGIYTVFSNDIGPLKLLRNMGLAMADKAGPIKRQVIKYAMGIN